jgi:integrase/recombinase XerD
MTDLRQILCDYLSVRRSLGFKLERMGKLLADFIAFLADSGADVITTPLAVDWACKSTAASARSSAQRLAMVRAFARYVHTIDPRTEIPRPDLLPYIKRRLPPYIYDDTEITALLSATGRSGDPFRAHTYGTVIGLLASTGMRVGEAIALDRKDVDDAEKVITIRDSKFGKSREVPLHPTTFEALADYARARDRRFRRSSNHAFFVSLAGTRLFYTNVHLTFLKLVDWAGLAQRKPRRPRIHDLRHTFAVRTLIDTLIDWYQAGLDVERQLPLLSTYLGHVSPSSTYWYLSAVPQLLGVAARRLQESWGDLP